METWKPLKNYPGYEYSDTGLLRSINYKRTGKVRVLSPAKSTDGYLKTMLKGVDGRYHTIALHRVIMESELPKPAKHEVNHKNGIKTDNRIDNLEWITHSANCKHSFDMGLQKPKRGELNGMAKLTVEKVAELRRMKREGGRFWGRNEIAKELGVSGKHLQKIVNESSTCWRS